MSAERGEGQGRETSLERRVDAMVVVRKATNKESAQEEGEGEESDPTRAGGLIQARLRAPETTEETKETEETSIEESHIVQEVEALPAKAEVLPSPPAVPNQRLLRKVI